MSYKDKNFQDRYNDPMWRHSERKFESLFPHRWTRFGLDLDESEVDTWKLDPFIRHKPDYACQIDDGPIFFMEVQGTGKDRTHKFKLEKLKHLGDWDKVHDVWFWLWDDKLGKPTLISFRQIRLATALGQASKGSFDGNKRPYWALDVVQVNEMEDWDEGRYGT